MTNGAGPKGRVYSMGRSKTPARIRFATSLAWCWVLMGAVAADPQARLLNKGCSQYKATNATDFYANRNARLAELRTELRSKRFATAQRVRGSAVVFSMAQCRNYLSFSDCVACFDVAALQIRNCSLANGARVIYDGCFLRYESNNFYRQTTQIGSAPVCRNRTASRAGNFDAALQKLLADLKIATPKIPGFFAAIKRKVIGGRVAAIYGVAQCAETATQNGCESCLEVAVGNVQGCSSDTDGRAIDSGCFLRYSTTPFFADNQTTNITPFLKHGSSTKKAIIGGVVGGVGLVLLMIGIFIWFKHLRKLKTTTGGDILDKTELRGPLNFRYKDLKYATRNFSQETKLGEGGFGEVYKGILRNGKTVAVKRVAIGPSSTLEAGFENEVKLISNVHHRNLIRLLGCCSKGPELLLVYEYMENGSLDKFLFGERQGSLNWRQRYDIILGTAMGLAYLHEEFHACIIHRDIKSSNILLDDACQPKIADFGLVKLFPGDKSHMSTGFAGTLEYTAPEYAMHGELSEKVDIFGYGIVVLEILSGQRSAEADPEREYLLERAWKVYENGMYLKLVDESLERSEYNSEEVKRILDIALMCTQSPATLRPRMSEVVVMLKNKSIPEEGAIVKPSGVDTNRIVRGDKSTYTASSFPCNATNTSVSSLAAS